MAGAYPEQSCSALAKHSILKSTRANCAIAATGIADRWQGIIVAPPRSALRNREAAPQWVYRPVSWCSAALYHVFFVVGQVADLLLVQLQLCCIGLKLFHVCKLVD